MSVFYSSVTPGFSSGGEDFFIKALCSLRIFNAADASYEGDEADEKEQRRYGSENDFEKFLPPDKKSKVDSTHHHDETDQYGEHFPHSQASCVHLNHSGSNMSDW